MYRVTYMNIKCSVATRAAPNWLRHRTMPSEKVRSKELVHTPQCCIYIIFTLYDLLTMYLFIRSAIPDVYSCVIAHVAHDDAHTHRQIAIIRRIRKRKLLCANNMFTCSFLTFRSLSLSLPLLAFHTVHFMRIAIEVICIYKICVPCVCHDMHSKLTNSTAIDNENDWAVDDVLQRRPSF